MTRIAQRLAPGMEHPEDARIEAGDLLGRQTEAIRVEDVLEAARVDGATRWQRLRLVTLPIIRPILAPAVTLGAGWTFNMFNVVFLVSGGDPDGTTDILVSEAYRWAFTRVAQYGYAAAYSVLIFLLLSGATRLAEWRRRARQAAPLGTPSSTDGLVTHPGAA